ncbi:MAG: hypothetical protein ACRDUV_08765 [Pseudonocardiaceae bacterium]
MGDQRAVARGVEVRSDPDDRGAAVLGEDPAHHVDRVAHHHHWAGEAVELAGEVGDQGRVGQQAAPPVLGGIGEPDPDTHDE